MRSLINCYSAELVKAVPMWTLLLLALCMCTGVSAYEGMRIISWDVKGAPDLTKSNNTQGQPLGFQMLDETTTRRHRIYEANEQDGTYNHAVIIDYYDDFFLLSWKNCPYDEDCDNQRIVYVTSDDGLAWPTVTPGTLSYNVLFPPVGEALFSMPPLYINGHRYAVASPNQWSIHPGFAFEEKTLLRRVYKDKALGPIFWAGGCAPPGFERISEKNGFQCLKDADEHAQEDLKLFLSGRYLACPEPQSGSLKCEATYGTGQRSYEEMAYWRIPNETTREVMIERNSQNNLKFTARFGPEQDWLEPMFTNFPNIANLNAGRLSNGDIFLLHNTGPTKYPDNSEREEARDPAVISVSKDGFSFQQSIAIASCLYPPFNKYGCQKRFKGRHKDGGPSYAQGVALKGKGVRDALYVAISNRKEDIWVMRIEYSSLPKATIGKPVYTPKIPVYPPITTPYWPGVEGRRCDEKSQIEKTENSTRMDCQLLCLENKHCTVFSIFRKRSRCFIFTNCDDFTDGHYKDQFFSARKP